ncbi:MAG: 3-oxoacyl-[acyl-carrier-protein] reductase [Actinomycetota bacterium]
MPEQVALVTGGSRGIGRAVALSLARSGSSVAVSYLDRADDAKETVKLVEETGVDGICVQADVGDRADVERLFAEVEGALGSVEVLVNNAGVRADGLALRLSDESWDDVLRTNLYGTFACCRRALRPMLRSRWGRIVNVASVAGLRGSRGQTNYSASKAGVIGLTKSLALEVGGRGITVNAIAPGLVTTDLTLSLGEERLKEIASAIPQKRAATPEDIASAVSFLCGDDASYVTGEVLVIDGGMTA